MGGRYQERPLERNWWELMTFAVPLSLFASALGWWGWTEYTNEPADWVRGNQTAEYNAAVRAWDGGRRREWAAVQSIMIHDWFPGQDPHDPIVLSPDESDEQLGRLLMKADDVLTYRPLRYSFRGKVKLSPTGGVQPWDNLHANLQFTTSRQSIHRPLIRNLMLTGSDEVRTGNWKQCQFQRRGSLDQSRGVCTVYKRLSSLCFRLPLRHPGDGMPPEWGPEPGEDVAGCDITSKGLTTSYHTVPVPRYQDKANPGPIGGAQVPEANIIARSPYDPYLIAQNISGWASHRGRFAPSRKERLSLSYLMLGGAGVAAGLLAMLSVCFCMKWGCWAEDPPPVHRPLSIDRAGPYRGAVRGTAAAGKSSRGRDGGGEWQRLPQRDPSAPYGDTGGAISPPDASVSVEMRVNSKGYSSQ